MEPLVEAILITAVLMLLASLLPAHKRDKPMTMRDAQHAAGMGLFMVFVVCRFLQLIAT